MLRAQTVARHVTQTSSDEAMSAEASAPHTPINVFLLAGQSNMAGADAEFTGPLRATEADHATAIATAALFHGSGFGDRGYEGWGAVRGHKLPATPEYPRFVPGADMQLGPEVGFARALHAAGWRDVALIKVFGNFAADCTITAGAGQWPWSQGGEIYEGWMRFVDARLQELSVDTDHVRIRGVVWFQGIDDALAGPAFADRYETNLRRMVSVLRTRFSCPAAPFVLARSVNSGIALRQEGGEGKDGSMAVVRRAQVAVANALGSGEGARGRDNESESVTPWVDVDDLPNVNTHHFPVGAQLEIGRRLGVVMMRQLEGASLCHRAELPVELL